MSANCQQFTATLTPGVPIPGPEGPQGPAGPQGDPGPVGPSATLGIGRIASDGTVYGYSGWACDHSVAGQYVVTHNLNLDPFAYVVLVCPGDNSLGTLAAAPQSSLILVVTQQAANSFTINAIDGSNLNPLDASFNFAVFQ